MGNGWAVVFFCVPPLKSVRPQSSLMNTFMYLPDQMSSSHWGGVTAPPSSGMVRKESAASSAEIKYVYKSRKNWIWWSTWVQTVSYGSWSGLKQEHSRVVCVQISSWSLSFVLEYWSHISQKTKVPRLHLLLFTPTVMMFFLLLSCTKEKNNPPHRNAFRMN